MTTHTAEELELAALLIECLDLEDTAPGEIGPEAPLFGDGDDSLGLDSIDALEIALAVSQQYGVELKADDENNKKVFASLRSLSEHIQAKLA